MKYSIFIGADPAFRKKGFGIAVIDRNDKTVNFKVFKNGFLDFQSWLISDAPTHAVICVENSNLQKKTFDMTGGLPVVARKSRNVGKNQAVSQLTVDVCRMVKGFTTIEISPLEKGRKWSEATALSVMRSEGLKFFKNKISQDEIDSLQIALKGQQLNKFKSGSKLP